MELEQKLKSIQTIYAGVLADAVCFFEKFGIFQEVTAEKKKIQLLTGKAIAQNYGLTKPEEVFIVLADIFGCADWRITRTENGFEAEASSCMLCAFAKKMNTASPCHIYCLNPMEGMVKGLNPKLQFLVRDTLWDGKNCRVEVK